MLFCDSCGTHFAPGTLRPESRFCSSCGKELSEYVKSQRAGLYSSPEQGTANKKRKSNAIASPGEASRLAENKLKKNPGSDDDKESPGVKKGARGRPRKSTIAGHPTETDTNDQTTSTTSREEYEPEVSLCLFC
jgi:predicted  nucleic acid-binding Zn-ribbon protein